MFHNPIIFFDVNQRYTKKPGQQLECMVMTTNTPDSIPQHHTNNPPKTFATDIRQKIRQLLYSTANPPKPQRKIPGTTQKISKFQMLAGLIPE
jgi:hypothetical protein